MMLFFLSFAIIAVAAIALPLLERRRRERPAPNEAAVQEREAIPLADLHDLEFDYRLGKLSEEDYHELRAQFVRRAAAGLKAVDAAREAKAAREKELDDRLEREVAARRGNRRPATDSERACTECGRAAGPGDRFCARCGAPLPPAARATGLAPVTRRAPAVHQQRPQTSEARPATREKRNAIGQKSSISKWLLAAGAAGVAWAAIVGVFSFRARAAFESQRPIATLGAGNYQALAILPADPGFAFLGGNGGLRWSRDEGATWQPASIDGSVTALAVHPAEPQQIYLAGTDRFLRSDDGGRNWEAIPAELPGRAIRALAVAPDQPDTLYAFITGQGLWRSDNGGTAWTPVDPTFTENVTSLAVTPGAIYVGTEGVGVLASPDGGATWASANGIVNGALGSPRVRALAYDPATATLYAGTDRGLSFTTNVGSGWTRRPFNGDVAALALGPDGTTMLVVTSAGDVYRSRDRGVTWGK